MKMSDGEKLIVLMLCELYEHLGVTGEVEPEFLKSAIFGNHLWGIPWKYSGIPFNHQETPGVVQEVLRILDMWSLIENSYAGFSESEKKRLAELAKPFGQDPRFKGFDGNNESEHMASAAFIVNELERFQEFQGRSLNSHAPSLEAYERMLPVFHSIREEAPLVLLSVEQLAAILSEMIHPSRR